VRLQAKLAFVQDLEEVSAVAAERGWKVRSPGDGVAEVRMTSAIDKEAYWLRLVGDAYPHPCSILPFDPATGSTAVRAAWPACTGFRPTTDLCLNLSSEGFALHPQWASDPTTAFDTSGNPLLRVLEEVQLLLNTPGKYQGRTT
jgi:hypothetical protein